MRLCCRRLSEGVCHEGPFECQADLQRLQGDPASRQGSCDLQVGAEAQAGAGLSIHRVC